MRQFLIQPEVKEVAIRTSSNIVKLGAIAGIAVFAQNLFKTAATATIQKAQMDYHTVRDLIRNR